MRLVPTLCILGRMGDGVTDQRLQLYMNHYCCISALVVFRGGPASKVEYNMLCLAKARFKLGACSYVFLLVIRICCSLS